MVVVDVVVVAVLVVGGHCSGNGVNSTMKSTRT